MSIGINFDEYDGMYKRIINKIEIDIAIPSVMGEYYEGGTSIDMPLSYDDSPLFKQNILYINEKYFLSHKKEMLDLIIDTILSTRKTDLELNGNDIITSDVIKAICESKFIKSCSLCSEIGLDHEDIELLLRSGLEKINCSINYDKNPELLYKNLDNVVAINYPSICNIDINHFVNNHVDLTVDQELTSEELERLQKLFGKYPQEIVRIEFECDTQVKELLSKIKADVIVVKNKEYWNAADYEFFDNNYNNIKIELKNEEQEDIFVSPKELIEKDKILNSIIEEVKILNLSPIEQYMYLYNITKMYKEYKEVPEDLKNDLLAGDIRYTLFNDYMTCVGYASLLDELVKKLDNPNLRFTPYSCVIDEDALIIGHRRGIVKIDDKKYNISGVYISDPTWDCVDYYRKTKLSDGNVEIEFEKPIAHYDYYNHFLMTKDEVMDEDVEYASSDVSDVLFKNVAAVCSKPLKELILSETDVTVEKLYCNHNITRNETNEKIASISQVPIGMDIFVPILKRVYSKIYEVDDVHLDKMIEETIKINQEYQQKSFNVYKDKFDYFNNKKIN